MYEPIEEVSPGLVKLHIKDMPLTTPFAISKNWLALGRAVSPSHSGFFRVSDSIQKILTYLNTISSLVFGIMLRKLWGDDNGDV